MKTYKQFMEGNPTTRMLKKSKTQVTGNISADRGDSEGGNRKKRKGLEKDLKKKGMAVDKLAERFPIRHQNLIKCLNVDLGKQCVV